MKVGDQRNQQKPLGLVPERVAALPLSFGVGHQCGDELQNVFFTVDISHRIVFHALGKVYTVKEF